MLMNVLYAAFILFFGEKTTRMLGLWKSITGKYGHHKLLRAKYKENQDILQ